MNRIPGTDSAGKVLVNAQSMPMRLLISDASERIAPPWSLTRLEPGLTITATEPIYPPQEAT